MRPLLCALPLVLTALVACKSTTGTDAPESAPESAPVAEAAIASLPEVRYYVVADT